MLPLEKKRLTILSVLELVRAHMQGSVIKSETKSDGFQAIVSADTAVTKKGKEYAKFAGHEQALDLLNRVSEWIRTSVDSVQGITSYTFELCTRDPDGVSDLSGLWQKNYKQIVYLVYIGSAYLQPSPLWEVPAQQYSLEDIWRTLHTEEGVVVELNDGDMHKTKFNSVCNLMGLSVLGAEPHPDIECYSKILYGLVVGKVAHVLAMSDYTECLLGWRADGKPGFYRDHIRDYVYSTKKTGWSAANSFNALNAVCHASKKTLCALSATDESDKAAFSKNLVFLSNGFSISSTSSRMPLTNKTVFLDDFSEFVVVVGPNSMSFSAKKADNEPLMPYVRLQAMSVVDILQNHPDGTQTVRNDLYPMPYNRYEGALGPIRAAHPDNLVQAVKENTLRQPSRARHFELFLPGVRIPTLDDFKRMAISDAKPLVRAAPVIAPVVIAPVIASVIDPKSPAFLEELRKATSQLECKYSQFLKRMMTCGIQSQQMILNEALAQKLVVEEKLKGFPEGLERAADIGSKYTVGQLIQLVQSAQPVQPPPPKRSKRS